MLFRLRTPSNPLFAAEFRLMRWPRKPHELDQYRNYILGISLALIAIFVIPAHFLFGMQTFYVLLSLLFIGNIAATLASDLYCVMVTIDNISQLVASGAWDLLRITAMTEDNIIDAKTAIATIRARRATTIAVVMRILPFAAVPLVGVIEALLSSDWRYVLAGATGIIAVVVYLFPAIAYAWAIEPGWQIQTLVACGVTIALTVHNQALAVMLGFATALTIRAAQFLLFFILGFVLIQTMTPLVSSRYGPGALALPPLVLIAALIVGLFHSTLIKVTRLMARKAATPSAH